MDLGVREKTLLVVVAVIGASLLLDLALYAIVAVALAAFLLATGVMAIRAYVKMATADPVDVGEVEAGMSGIALTGTAGPAVGTTSAPLTGEETLVARSKVEVRARREEERGGWGPVGDKAAYEPFVVDDGTGEILVDPNGAMWSFEDESWTVDGGEQPPSPIREFLEESDEARDLLADVVHERDRRFQERRLDPGEEVYVYGSAKSGPAEGAPEHAVDPYIGSDRAEEGHVENSISWSMLPGVGGDPNESDLFTVADTQGMAVQRQALLWGVFALGFGVVMLLVAVMVQVS